MRKGIRKLISFTLLAALLLQLLPVSVFATEEESAISGDDILSNEQEPAAAEDLAGGDNLQDAEILFEETSLREENVKHFRLDNGSYIAVQYDTPIHYRNNNGKWTDFDNTLRPVNSLDDGGVASYRVTNGDSVRVFAADANAEVLLAVQKGDYGLSLTPVREADAELPAAPDPSAITASYELTAQEAQTASVSAAVLETASAGEAAESDDLLSEAQPDKIYSALEYPAFFQGATLRYENYANTVKENIVISAPQAEYAYSFRMETDGLTPALQTDGCIFLSAEDGNVIYTIPAPYMIDDNGEYSYAAAYTLTGSGNTWILTVTADAEWMNDPSRAYPVAIDPTVTETTGDDVEIFGGYVRSSNPSSPDTSDTGVYVGHNSSSGKTQSYFHIGSLISLPAGSEVSYAGFSLYHYAQSGASMKADIHEVPLSSQPSDWQNWANNLTWNNRPDYNPIVIDRQELTSANCNQFITWDVTKLAFDWYENEGSARCFALTAENENTTNARATFYGPRKTTNRPRLTVAYRNTRGIESYYTYQTADIGRAGTSCISDYSMQNTLVVPLASLPSNVMPFSVSLVNNSSMAGSYFSDGFPAVHTKNFSNMIIGAGWKLSLQETVVSQVVNGTTYLIYADSDGTEHYFHYSSGAYYDEDGLGLKISVSGSTYTMSDDNGNTKIFTNGYLTEIKDAYGNALYYCYDGVDYSTNNTLWKPTSSGAHKITTVWRKNVGASTVEQLLLIGYNGNRVSTIIPRCDYSSDTSKNAHRIVLNAETANNATVLTSIDFPDGVSAQYTYFVGDDIPYWKIFRLKTAFDTEAKYGIEYSYSFNTCVKNIYEYVQTPNGEKEYGTKLHGYKRAHSQAVYRYYGKDGEQNTEDDLLSFHITDTFGRTVNEYTTDNTEKHILGVGAAAYTQNNDTSKKNNRLSSSASGGQQGENLLKNSSAESSNDNSWVGATRTSSAHYTGNNAFTANSTFYQTVDLSANQAYTFSAYIKQETAPTSGGVRLSFLDSSDEPLASSALITNSTSGINGGWQRISVTYKPSADTADVRAAVEITGDQTVYVDCLQLEREDAASAYNLLEDGSLENLSTLPTSTNFGWSCSGTVSLASEPDGTYFGSNYVSMQGGNQATRLNQTVQLNLPAGSTFIFSGWGKADADPASLPKLTETDVNKPFFGIIIRLFYADNTSEPFYFSFDPYYNGWQYAQGIVVPTADYQDKDISYAIVVAAYDYNLNTAYFDNLSLRNEPAYTYTYDDNGNPTAATAAKTGTETAQYASNGIDLTKYTAANGTQYTYTYNTKHDVLTAACAGVKNTYSYDTSGNTTNSKLQKNTNTGVYLQSSAAMTADRNYTASATDVNGNTSSYTYDSYRGHVLSTTAPDGTLTNNLYIETNGRPAQTYQSGVFSVLYNYADGALSALTRKTFRDGAGQWQKYSFTTNAWGQQTAIQLASSSDGSTYNSPVTLATYEYEANGGNLTKMSYGNGDEVEYCYDKLDRLIEKTYIGSGDSVAYSYDSNGAIARMTHTRGGSVIATYEFEYDSLGRMLRSVQYDKNGNMVQCTGQEYGEYGQLKEQSWDLGGTHYSENFTYHNSENATENDPADGRLTQMVTASGATLNYSYDGLKRLEKTTLKSGDSTLLETRYAYRAVSGSRTSAQVEYHKVLHGSEILTGAKYTYDNKGNIVKIQESVSPFTTIAEYSYDSRNQLIQETYDGDTYTYTYDTAGNLLTESKNGTVTKTYSYNDSLWHDKLTAVNTVPITYDAIGNPDTYQSGSGGSWTLSWENGRQLASVERSATSGTLLMEEKYSNEYDLDGIRSKKVSVVTKYNINSGSGGGTVMSGGNSVQAVVKPPINQPEKKLISKTTKTHTYLTQNGKVMRDTLSTTVLQTKITRKTEILDFIYDESGRPFALIYTNGAADPDTYYYVLNLQGDVVALTDDTGAIVAEYVYNAWGEKLHILDSDGNEITSSSNIAIINPLRYRGYYYDIETGFYYLQSRYYDPVNHRFINADSYASTDSTDAIACNMFAYCNNNPTIYADFNGQDRILIIYDSTGDLGMAGLTASLSLDFCSRFQDDISVDYCPCSSISEFKDAWNQQDNKDPYDYVLIYAHGSMSSSSIYINNSKYEATNDVYGFSGLKKRKVNKGIILASCYAAVEYEGVSVAKCFANLGQCTVTASSSIVYITPFGGRFWLDKGCKWKHIKPRSRAKIHGTDTLLRF